MIWTCVKGQIDGMKRTQEVKLPRLSQGRDGRHAERITRDDVDVVESGRYFTNATFLGVLTDVCPETLARLVTDAGSHGQVTDHFARCTEAIFSEETIDEIGGPSGRTDMPGKPDFEIRPQMIRQMMIERPSNLWGWYDSSESWSWMCSHFFQPTSESISCPCRSSLW